MPKHRIDDTEYTKPYTRENLGLIERGGPGSGHFGHKGRPGQVGGSLPSDGRPSMAGFKWEAESPGEWEKRAFDTLAEALEYGDGRFTFTDDGRMLWALISSVRTGEEEDAKYSRDDIDIEREVETVLDVYDHFLEILRDPANHKAIAAGDRSGQNMINTVEAWIEQLERMKEEGYDRLSYLGRNLPSLNIIITNNGDRVGAGSSSTGGKNAKVFWEPVTLDVDKRETEIGATMSFGISPVYVLVHELHHGFGSGSELDVFSNAVAADYYIRNPDIMGPEVERRMIQEIAGNTWSASRRASGESRDIILRNRAMMGWLYGRNTEYFDQVFTETRQYQETGDPPTRRSTGWWGAVDENVKKLKRWAREYGP